MAKSRASNISDWEETEQPDRTEDARRPAHKRAERAGRVESVPSRKRVLYAVVFLFFLMVFIAAVALAYQVNTFLATDPRFTLRAIAKDGLLLADGPVELVGVEHAPARELYEVFQEDVGKSLYLLPLEQRRRELEAVDWVETATVTRLWPNRLRVTVVERTPIAVAAIPTRRKGDAYQMMLVDRNGEPMRLPPAARFDLPVVFGLSFDQESDFRRARMELLQRIQSEVQPLNARFSELDVSDPANLRVSMTMDGRNVTLLLGREKYLPRVRTFLEEYQNLMKANPSANLFDMRLDDQIITSREGLSGA